jgi:hypothetical protein
MEGNKVVLPTIKITVSEDSFDLIPCLYKMLVI